MIQCPELDASYQLMADADMIFRFSLMTLDWDDPSSSTTMLTQAPYLISNFGWNNEIVSERPILQVRFDSIIARRAWFNWRRRVIALRH